ncbi:MAG TPA: VOC family protein [Caulobacteraceae bacterium]|jgi:catechol 2,3-dioxygenase-like lactoylglutathione lyase family enzyme
MNPGWLETSFAVADVARTSAFYEALGLQVVETADAGKIRTLEAGDCRIALFQDVLDPPEAQLIFWQGDVEGCADKLMEAGAEIVRPRGRLAEHDRGDGLIQTPEGAVAIMARDPDGQLIYLVREPGVTRISPPASGSNLDRGFCQVSLPVKDPDRTAAFYQLLGFRRRANGDPRVAPLTNGECRICLYQGYLDPDELQLNFWQGDVDAMAAVARREGLRFYREPGRDDAGAAFMLTDPDGRPVFFIKMAKYSAADFISATGEMLA